eukprot:TRINITY_DN11038_c0_g1_i2.p1 TRINITY_DN11038_c0_g1~~TRINITY_DN11038_c0_g1_i2.p1  ORF type:complete len:259 (-),score=20.90 TRINITY_DN11038_c0_g1_i2:352-1128(-)
MKSMWVILGFSLLETAITISVVAMLDRLILVVLVAPVALASLCRSSAAVAYFFIARREVLLASTCALSVAVLFYLMLQARNSSHMLNKQDRIANGPLAIKGAILIACAWCSAVATSALLYVVLRPLRRSALDNGKETPTVLSLDDALLRTFVLEEPGTLANDTDGDLAPTASCCVCLDEFVCGDVICELLCHHSFHKDCIEGWVHSLNSRTKLEKSVLCPLRCDMASKDASTTRDAAASAVATRMQTEDGLSEGFAYV